jgi:hypothetical protein
MVMPLFINRKKTVFRSLLGPGIWFVFPCCICTAEPRFYHNFDTLNDDVYNQRMVFDAADSCGVDTDVDAIKVMRTLGYLFIKEFPWHGHYRILRTQRPDAQWEHNRLVMYDCFDDRYDTVFVVDTFPEWSPEVSGFNSELSALRIFQKCRNFTKVYDPLRRMVLFEQLFRNRFVVHLYKEYSTHAITFKIRNDSLVVLENKKFVH